MSDYKSMSDFKSDFPPRSPISTVIGQGYPDIFRIGLRQIGHRRTEVRFQNVRFRFDRFRQDRFQVRFRADPSVGSRGGCGPSIRPRHLSIRPRHFSTRHTQHYEQCSLKHRKNKRFRLSLFCWLCDLTWCDLTWGDLTWGFNPDTRACRIWFAIFFFRQRSTLSIGIVYVRGRIHNTAPHTY